MPKIPGTLDGQHFDDMRLVHLPVPMVMWYAKCCLFDAIIKVNFRSTHHFGVAEERMQAYLASGRISQALYRYGT